MDSPYRLAAPAPPSAPPAAVIAVVPAPEEADELEPPIFVGEVEADADLSFNTPEARRRLRMVGIASLVISLLLCAPAIWRWWFGVVAPMLDAVIG